MKEILLTKGKVALVDDEDYALLSQLKWCYGKHGYACRVSRNWYCGLMHRLIMNTPAGMETDHINRNKLDNRRCNLRVCTRSENMRNSERRANNTSGFVGVSWNKNAHKWVANITHNDRSIHIGYFDNIEHAARAHDAKAKELHGEFAMLNFGDVKG